MATVASRITLETKVSFNKNQLTFIIPIFTFLTLMLAACGSSDKAAITAPIFKLAGGPGLSNFRFSIVP